MVIHHRDTIGPLFSPSRLLAERLNIFPSRFLPAWSTAAGQDARTRRGPPPPAAVRSLPPLDLPNPLPPLTTLRLSLHPLSPCFPRPTLASIFSLCAARARRACKPPVPAHMRRHGRARGLRPERASESPSLRFSESTSLTASRDTPPGDSGIRVSQLSRYTGAAVCRLPASQHPPSLPASESPSLRVSQHPSLATPHDTYDVAPVPWPSWEGHAAGRLGHPSLPGES
jgi:hypothetical protein